jgi:hypothetical protein
MEEFDPEAYLDSKLDTQRTSASSQNGKEKESDDRDRSDRKKDSRRDRSRSRDRRRSRSKDRRRSRDRRSRSRDRRDDRSSYSKDKDPYRRDDRKYDDGYKYDRDGPRASEEAAGITQIHFVTVDPSIYPNLYVGTHCAAPKTEEDGFERDLRTVFVAQVRSAFSLA